jgi:inner membrane protein
MSPITHALLSWLVACAPRETTRRERLLITLGGLVPDVDGLGIIPDLLTRTFTDAPTAYFQDYHHLLHTLPFALGALAGALALAPSGARLRAAGLVTLTFHLHLLCDLAGSRGPDGSQWEIPYLWPLSPWPQLRWSGQWALDAWPNLAITAAALALTLAIGVRRGRTILELISTKIDDVLVRTLRARFGDPTADGEARA